MEANTDRLWWTIGIIVIGGILITASCKLFPEVMNSVALFFKNTLDSGIQQLSPNLPGNNS